MDEEGEPYIETVVVPYYKNKRFVFVTKQFTLENVYFNKKGSLEKIK